MAGAAIFIGYRRDDTADVAGRIFDALEARFGRDRLFKDVDNIPPGVDFAQHIKRVLPRCRVALLLIGPRWATIQDGAGSLRLDDRDDPVRVEVETALATQGLYVIPVLVNGAELPRADLLPESIRPLLRLNAAVIRRDPDFREDVRRVLAELQAHVEDTKNVEGQYSVEEKLVLAIVEGLDRFHRKRPAAIGTTLQELVEFVVQQESLRARLGEVVNDYQRRLGPGGGRLRVLLPLDPLDVDPNQAALAAIAIAVVARIPEIVPRAKGTPYEGVCIGLGDRG